jgi:starch phosphorylase
MPRGRQTRFAKRSELASDVCQRVNQLAMNLQWTWNAETLRLFAALDPVAWRASNHNPVKTLASLSPERREALAADPAFIIQLKRCEQYLRKYRQAKTWFARNAKGRDKRLKVGYFCSEYALHESMPQYAGGLGVLAGDHLKSASDLGVPLVAVGRLYRHGYYEQQLNSDGSTRVVYPSYDFSEWPLEDTGQAIAVTLARRKVHARIWKLQVGRTELYLLDADIPDNRPGDRALTHYLYGGDAEARLRQQILLGVGGFRALQALGIRPTVYHLNEGHAAFCGLERLRKLRAQGKSFEKASEIVRASTVFTTHTPVPAGHDRYAPRLITRYLAPIREALGISPDELLALGREDPKNRKEPFCMTILALKLSARVNGVSRLHGRVSREMWRGVYGVRSAAKVPIGHVTNGIHTQTWLAPEAEPLYKRFLRPRCIGATPRDNWAARAGKIPAADFWALRNTLRAKLVNLIRDRLVEQIQRQIGPVEDLAAAHQMFATDVLTIGFARRFATYKRAPLIFRDPARLAAILNHKKRPVQLVFAGKAHPRDAQGQAFAQRVYRAAHTAGLRGRVVVLENYDMHVGRLLTAGCDVWLNNPVRPMEASGTSGMKPPLHGGLNCSILDGWWPEAYNGRNGWAIGDGTEARSRAQQDQHDAEAIYSLLEKEIAPLFYKRDRGGIPRDWVRMMTSSLKTVACRFSTHRMLGEYVKDYYLPAHR